MSNWVFNSLLIAGLSSMHLLGVGAKFTISDKDFKEAFAEASRLQLQRFNLNQRMNDGPLISMHPIFRQHQLQNPTTEVEKDDKSAELILDFMTALCRRKKCTDKDKEELKQISLPQQFRVFCRKRVNCGSNTNQYRTYDGTCNNLRRPLEGSSPGPHLRFLDPDYDDKIQSPRSRSVNGGPLPHPRVISDVIIKDNFIEDTDLTTILTYFGQTIDHDFTMTPGVTANGGRIVCCPGAEGGTPNHPACMPITIFRNDSFYSRFNQNCMEFVRSGAIENPDCKFDSRQQMNQITSFLDASFVYGSDEKSARELRKLSQGLMKTGVSNLLPPNIRNGCTRTSNTCPFKAGDSRSNENPGMTVFHTLFLREHNRIAKEVKRLRSRWNDEKIYQETRKIVIAFVQNIIYNEYLPLVLGPSAMRKYNLRLSNGPKRNLYNVNIRPMIRNSFATAAYRFGHSLVTPTIKLDFVNRPSRDFKLEDKLLATQDLYSRNIFDAMMRGMSTHAVQKFDSFMTSSLSKHLFKSLGADFGRDLASINIQRGRDHGLPSYNKFREFCGLRRLSSFRSLRKSQLGRLERIYRSINDVDLFVGGLSEPSVPGGIVGETFACIIGRQFEILMKGDRFFFTNGANGSSSRGKRDVMMAAYSFLRSRRTRRRRFGLRSRRIGSRRRITTTTSAPPTNPQNAGHQYSSAQIREFRKANIARIICDNSGLTRIQAQPMKSVDRRSNPVVSCSNIQRPDISRILPR